MWPQATEPSPHACMCAHLCVTTLKTSVRQRTYCSAVKPAEPQKSRETEHSQPAAEKHNHKIFYLPNSIHLLLILEGIIIQLSSLISLYHEQESFLQLSQVQPEACTWQHLCPEKHLKQGWQLISPLAACSSRLSSKITCKTAFPYLKVWLQLQILLPVQLFFPRLKSALELVFSPYKCTYTLIKSTLHHLSD